MLYPLIFSPIIKTMVWGSESWEISCRPDEMSIIENGTLAGMRFDDYINRDRKGVLGRGIDAFPLLVKIIEARDALSVQVHPTDEYAREKGAADSGKSEAWYILTPPHDGELIIGLRRDTPRDAIANDIEPYLRRQRVSEGEIIHIPAGLVHALTPGARIAEIQQNSDITYRIYDYNRGTRELHIADALAVVDITARPHPVQQFALEKLTITAPTELSTTPNSFTILTCVSGQCEINSPTLRQPLPSPRSTFLPATLGHYKITPHGHAVILKTSV
jgi:mannose-6-phosphate isomerase